MILIGTLKITRMNGPVTTSLHYWGSQES
jgi:hypothetical protein